MRHETIDTEKAPDDASLLARIYLDMDEAGREKLKEVSEKILDIWATVNDNKGEIYG